MTKLSVSTYFINLSPRSTKFKHNLFFPLGFSYFCPSSKIPSRFGSQDGKLFRVLEPRGGVGAWAEAVARGRRRGSAAQERTGNGLSSSSSAIEIRLVQITARQRVFLHLEKNTFKTRHVRVELWVLYIDCYLCRNPGDVQTSPSMHVWTSMSGSVD